MDTATKSAVSAGDHVLTSNKLRVLHDSIGDELGVLNDICRVRDDARDQQLSVRQFHVAPYLPLVLVTDVARLQRIRARMNRQQQIDDVAERDVGEMWTMPAAPAHVIADALLGDPLERVVQ